jgi:hypothetical protein
MTSALLLRYKTLGVSWIRQKRARKIGLQLPFSAPFGSQFARIFRMGAIAEP